MTALNSTAVPPVYGPLLDSITTLVRLRIAHGAGVGPSIFVGRAATGSMRMVSLDLRSEPSRAKSIQEARQAATEMGADFSITVTGAFMLPHSLAHMHEAVVREFGSINNCPATRESVIFLLETPSGIFSREAAITRPSSSATKVMQEPGPFVLTSRLSGGIAGVIARATAPAARMRMH